MKTIALITIAIASLFASCKKEDKSDGNDVNAKINAFPKEALSADEKSSLLLMREEEKLAHDVYLAMFSKWQVNVFTNIASSEQKHTDAVLTLLNKYNLSDPADKNAPGVFKDSTLQSLYNQLVAQGNASVLDGFKVGATIEDLDIYDLNNWNAKIDNQDIQYVYQNLNKGSRNHLRSFYSQIVSAGGSYTARFISQTELDAIVNSAKETGSW